VEFPLTIQIDSPIVRNQLIIHHFIEQTVLIQDREQAMSFMYNGGRPINVKHCFCFAQQRGHGLRLAYMPSGGELTGPVRAWDGRPRISTDTEAQVK
jgi:structural maintenance of chromosomes protein 6